MISAKSHFCWVFPNGFFFYGRFEQKKAKDIWFYYIQEKADISTAYISKTKQVLMKKNG